MVAFAARTDEGERIRSSLGVGRGLRAQLEALPPPSGSRLRLGALPGAAFWARLALTNAQGKALGTLHLLDHRARPTGFSRRERALLRDLTAGLTSSLDPEGRAQRRADQFRANPSPRLPFHLEPGAVAPRSPTDSSEVAAARERTFWRTITDHAEVIVIVTDAHGIVADLNPYAARALEVRSLEALGRGVWSLFGDEHASALARRALRRLQRPAAALTDSASGELRWTSARSRKRKSASLSCVPLRAPDGAVLYFVITGIETSALREAQAASAQALRVRSDFLNYVTHELRTPLHAISGFCELLLEPGMGELSPEQTEFATEIRRAADHLFALISDLLDFNKVNVGAVRLEPRVVATEPLLRACIAMLEGSAARAGVRVSYEIAKGAHRLYGSERQIKQVIVNLLSNAVKFTPGGGRVHVRAEAEGQWQRIAVVDSGVGVDPSDFKRIFEPFTQAGDQAMHHRSFGLGLTLAQRLAELHGGQIEVASEPGEGSTFTLVLPSAGSPRALRSARSGDLVL
jgi:PAS domain S-box-containing protein